MPLTPCNRRAEESFWPVYGIACHQHGARALSETVAVVAQFATKSGRAGCLAPHSKLREAIIPTPRQQGVDGEEAQTGTPSWSWARLLGRVFALDMATCLPPLCGRREPCDLPFSRQGALRIIAAITQVEVIRKILRHLKRAADPPPIAPARARQATFDWVA